jgi:hypothetical protein
VRKPDLVYRLHRSADLGENVGRLFRRQRPGAQPLGQGRSVDVFHHKQRPQPRFGRVRLVVVEDPDQALVHNRRGPAGSSPEPAGRLGRRVIRQQLDRDRAGKLNIGTLPNLAGQVSRHPVIQPVPSGDQKGSAGR